MAKYATVTPSQSDEAAAGISWTTPHISLHSEQYPLKSPVPAEAAETNPDASDALRSILLHCQGLSCSSPRMCHRYAGAGVRSGKGTAMLKCNQNGMWTNQGRRCAVFHK